MVCGRGILLTSGLYQSRVCSIQKGWTCGCILERYPPFQHRRRITAQTNRHSQWTMDGDFWYYKPKEVVFLCKLIISGICYSNEELSNTLPFIAALCLVFPSQTWGRKSLECLKRCFLQPYSPGWDSRWPPEYILPFVRRRWISLFLLMTIIESVEVMTFVILCSFPASTRASFLTLLEEVLLLSNA